MSKPPVVIGPFAGREALVETAVTIQNILDVLNTRADNEPVTLIHSPRGKRVLCAVLFKALGEMAALLNVPTATAETAGTGALAVTQVDWVPKPPPPPRSTRRAK